MITNQITSSINIIINHHYPSNLDADFEERLRHRSNNTNHN